MKRTPFSKLSFTMTGNRGAALEMARSRIVLLALVFIVAYTIVGIRLFDVMILQGRFWQDVEDTRAVEAAVQTKAPEAVRRGDIVDRNGAILATSLKTASLFADPALIVDAQETAKALATLFPENTYENYLEKLQKKGRFVWLKRNLVPEEQHAVMLIGDPGLAFQEEYKRTYPQGQLAPHIVGYVSRDEMGQAGLERAFNGLLETEDTVLKTTLDIRLQHALRQEIANTIDIFSAKGGAGIIMDVNNGDVLALVSLPDFDPNKREKLDGDQIFNRAALGVYELGSVFKIFSTAALLEKFPEALSMTFDAREPLKRGRFTISDYHPEKRVLTVPEVFMVSSNIGTALMGEEIGTEGLKAFYKKLGLLSKPDISLREVGAPLYPRPWRDINTLTASYGHGVAVSPIQLVAAVAPIVNGGLQVTPRFLKPEGEEEVTKTTAMRVYDEQNGEIMRSLMRLVVTEGTAKKADVPGYEVGGKTGTAEKPGAKGYDRKRLISSFMGAFPMSAPKYAVFVAIDEPQGTKESYGYATAGWTAAPTVARVVERMVSILGIPPVGVATAETQEDAEDMGAKTQLIAQPVKGQAL